LLNEEEEAPHPKNNRLISEQLKELGADIKEIEKVKRKYPMKITRYFFNLIHQKEDPIWKQCIPKKEELEDFYNIEDPLKEEEFTPLPYLVHKYPDRVLLLVSTKCAMYCRFCTRKRKVGRIQQIPMEDINRAINYIREHPEVRDVIISGGDPLTRPDYELEKILIHLREIRHIDIIRIGTRMPCVEPSRITKKLVNMLKKYHPLYVNIHFNHPMEITEESKRACELLANAGIPLGSQTVLLRGINDSPEIIKELMAKLLRIRVKPYYIYQCDLVKGVEHFRTPIETGINIMCKLQGYTSGLGVPHFVIDGEGGKIPVVPQYIKNISKEKIILTNYLGNMYIYPGLRNGLSNKKHKRKVEIIGLAYNLKRESGKNERFDKYAEFDDIETINAIQKALESGGYAVELLEADYDFFMNIKKSNVDFVFNIAEGYSGESRESHVPAILEMLNIPYSGSGVLTQAITLNKNRKKEILNTYGIPTPKYQVFTNAHQKRNPNLNFPLIVKPNSEGSSVGINNSSLVCDTKALNKQVSFVLKNYSQQVLVEEFCSGREFTVSLLGNHKPTVLPIVEITYDYLPDNINKFDSYEVKWIYDNPNSQIDPLVCPAKINFKLQKKIEKNALKTYETLGCVDFCRIDIRLDSLGIPNIIDVNALPGLIPDPKQNSRFPRACYEAGMSYNDMILEILGSALKRYNLID